MDLLIIITIALSLSMDAFSLSLAYGTLNLDKKTIRLLAVIVGIYHFFMPIIGMLIGTFILSFFPIKPDIIVFVVLIFIGIEMIIESFKETDKMNIMSKTELVLFGLAVSIDSFSVGVGLKSITPHILFSSLMFSISSLIFTYVGLLLGKKINDWIGKIATIIGGIVLVIIAFLYLFHM